MDTEALKKIKDRLTAIEVTTQAHSVYFEDLTEYLIKTLGNTEELKIKTEYMSNKLAKLESQLREKNERN